MSQIDSRLKEALSKEWILKIENQSKMTKLKKDSDERIHEVKAYYEQAIAELRSKQKTMEIEHEIALRWLEQDKFGELVNHLEQLEK